MNVISNKTVVIKTNIFLRYDDLDVKKQLNLRGASDLEIFSKLRDLKDDF